MGKKEIENQYKLKIELINKYNKFYYDKTKYNDQLKREMKNPDTIYQWRRVYCIEK